MRRRSPASEELERTESSCGFGKIDPKASTAKRGRGATRRRNLRLLGVWVAEIFGKDPAAL